jgi:Ca2+-binding EF-hand superfamily protein
VSVYAFVCVRIKRTFNTIDEDDSGEIEREEFHRLVRRLAPERSPEWINNQFDLADVRQTSLVRLQVTLQ